MSGFASKYLNRQNEAFRFSAVNLASEAGLIVVIPCFNEPEIATTLLSLFDCNVPKPLAVLVVINDAENATPEVKRINKKTFDELQNLKKQTPPNLKLEVFYAASLPSKHAGVGWARKIGMDWACSQFNRFEMPEGIIVSLDADALVSPNYFDEIFRFYKGNPFSPGATISFEHPLDNEETREAIVMYELYMRYYKQAMEYSGFPNAIFTLGSCFSVKANVYVAQGGMNRKKAGEDFYFLHKLIPQGRLGHITSTKVYPSARLSNRVPFGTGPVLEQYIRGKRELENTYPLSAFLILSTLFNSVDELYRKGDFESVSGTLPPDLHNFMQESRITDQLKELKQNCASVITFRKRFYHVFNAFQYLKWLNYVITHDLKKYKLLTEAQKLLKCIHPNIETKTPNSLQLLSQYRDLEKQKISKV